MASKHKYFLFSKNITSQRPVLKYFEKNHFIKGELVVTDTDLPVEVLLIGFPVLHHLGEHTKTLLEKHRDLLGSTGCSSDEQTNLMKWAELLADS